MWSIPSSTSTYSARCKQLGAESGSVAAACRRVSIPAWLVVLVIGGLYVGNSALALAYAGASAWLLEASEAKTELIGPDSP